MTLPVFADKDEPAAREDRVGVMSCDIQRL